MKTTFAVLFTIGICVGLHFIVDHLTYQPPEVEQVLRVVTYPEYLPSDTVTRYIIHQKIIPAKIDTPPIPPTIDTAAIIAQYLQRVIYTDTLVDDTTAFIAITDTLSHNRIQSRSIVYQNRRPTRQVTIQPTITLKPRAWHFNAGLAYSDRLTPVIGVEYKKISINYLYSNHMFVLLYRF